MSSYSLSSTTPTLTSLGWVGVGALLGASVLAVAAALWKLLVIGGVAFVAMAGGAWLGTPSRRA